MKLYFHKDPNGNFGDDLNLLLWPKLLPDVLEGHCFHDPKLRVRGDEKPSLMIGIGMLLNQHIPRGVPKAIMGTGTGYGERPEVDESWKVYFTRGPLTAEVLGLDKSVAITGGAILCAKYLPLSGTHRSSSVVGFMPHCSTAKTDEWKEICSELGLLYIDPQNSVETVFSELAGVDRLITEAMHGAILADTFRIPWLAVKTNEYILDFKWSDWCQSLELEFNPALLPVLWPLPVNAGLVKRLKQNVKRSIAKNSLRKVALAANYTLSSDQRHATCLERIEGKLEELKMDYKAGLFSSLRS